jgi:drug/metabolite transporter (DMT)-like permease
LAVAGGLCAACCWAMTGILAKAASRSMGGLSVFAWSAAAGIALSVIPAGVALLGTPVSAQVIAELAAAGLLNVLGLICQFTALASGRVTLVIPITSSEGAVAAVVAVATGVSQLATASWIALACVVIGLLVTASSHADESPIAAKRPALREIGLALTAAMLFGCGLFLQGRAGEQVPLGLAIAPPSIMGAALVALPMAIGQRLESPRRTGLLLPAIAAAELLGFLSYVVGSRESLPVAAVLASQFATVTVIVSVVFLGERPRRTQWLGYLLIAVGVAIISLQG